jgi:hypothetical protein
LIPHHAVLTLALHLLLLLVHLHEISLFLRILSTLNVGPSYMRHFFFLFVSDTNTSILVKTLSHFNLKLLILWTQLIVFSAGSEINKYMYIILIFEPKWKNKNFQNAPKWNAPVNQNMMVCNRF